MASGDESPDQDAKTRDDDSPSRTTNKNLVTNSNLPDLNNTQPASTKHDSINRSKVVSSSIKTPEDVLSGGGYQTASGNYNLPPQPGRFGAINPQRLATGNMVGGRARNGAKLAPLAPNMVNSRD